MRGPVPALAQEIDEDRWWRVYFKGSTRQTIYSDAQLRKYAANLLHEAESTRGLLDTIKAHDDSPNDADLEIGGNMSRDEGEQVEMGRRPLRKS